MLPQETAKNTTWCFSCAVFYALLRSSNIEGGRTAVSLLAGVPIENAARRCPSVTVPERRPPSGGEKWTPRKFAILATGCCPRPAPGQYWRRRNTCTPVQAPRRTGKAHQKVVRMVGERFVEFGRLQRRRLEADTRCRGGSRGRRDCHLRGSGMMFTVPVDVEALSCQN